MDKLLDRFFYYVSFDTQSKPHVRNIPSSDGQKKLASVLGDELALLGFEQIVINKQGCVTATLPGNVPWECPTIGFIAHLDTSPDCLGKNVMPQTIENYRGGDIALGIGDEVLSPVMFPVLHQLLGRTLITTDGKTLLGADDKAGIAEILTAMARMKAMNIPHGDIRIAFLSDEEIGKGAQYFDVENFRADWAYAVSGGGEGELEVENFNTATVTVRITGNQSYPAMAKGVTINALTLAMRFHQELPPHEVPEETEGREGFYHLISLKGSVSKAEMHYIISDFSAPVFEQRKALMSNIAKKFACSFDKECQIEIVIEDRFYNMADVVKTHPHIIEVAEKAMLDCDVQPVKKSVRGGTVGAHFSFKGVPCPNLFVGGYNYHSKHEFLTLEGMEKAVAVIARIAELTALNSQPVQT